MDHQACEFEKAELDRLVQALTNQDYQAVGLSLSQMVGPIEALLIYGSRSRGQATPSSDFDVLVLSEHEGHQGLRWDHGGCRLDIDVAGPSILDEPWLNRRYLANSRVIFASERVQAWLENLRTQLQRGPEAWNGPKRRRMASWLDRMLQRTQEPQLSGALRSAELAYSLPEMAVEVLGFWPGGVKENLRILEDNWPQMLGALQAWSQGASLEGAVELLKERLWPAPQVEEPT